jgi:aerobic-type carbon monoxide dehydrogenase small subunit (CoxS/CutS family)
MPHFALNVNGITRSADVDPGTPLLWVLRDALGLTGTKYGCGISLCGSCTVLVDGEAVRSCRLPVKDVGSRRVVTIEGLSGDGSHPVQKAWLAEEVVQCGWCQPGQILTAVALLARNPSPAERQVEEAMEGVICRCGTYPRIRRAVVRAAAEMRGAGRKP